MNSTQQDYIKATALYDALRKTDPDSKETWNAFELMHAAGDQVIAMAEFAIRTTDPERFRQIATCFTPKAARNPIHRRKLIDICMSLETD